MGKGRGRRRCRRCRSPHSALRSANTVQHNTTPNWIQPISQASVNGFTHVSLYLTSHNRTCQCVALFSTQYFIIVVKGPVSKSTSMCHIVTYFIKHFTYFSTNLTLTKWYYSKFRVLSVITFVMVDGIQEQELSLLNKLTLTWQKSPLSYCYWMLQVC